MFERSFDGVPASSLREAAGGHSVGIGEPRRPVGARSGADSSTTAHSAARLGCAALSEPASVLVRHGTDGRLVESTL